MYIILFYCDSFYCYVFYCTRIILVGFPLVPASYLVPGVWSLYPCKEWVPLNWPQIQLVGYSHNTCSTTIPLFLADKSLM